MGISLNGGTPKSSILIGFSIINHPCWGTPIFGNTHMVIWCSLRQLDWFNGETSKVALQTFLISEPVKTHSRKKKKKKHWALILSGNVECILIWGLIRIYFHAGYHLVTQAFCWFLATPPSLFYQLYLLKILEKTDHPAKKPQPLREFFNESNPRDIGPHRR